MDQLQKDYEHLKKELQEKIDNHGKLLNQLLITRTKLNRAIELLKGKYYLNSEPVEDDEIIRKWLGGGINLYDASGVEIDVKKFNLPEELLEEMINKKVVH